MCGQVGILFGTTERSQDEMEYLKRVFNGMLLQAEERGPFATGIAYVSNSGEHRISKLVMAAREFVTTDLFNETMADVDDTVTMLMGHTRWPTRGSLENVANAQPKRAGEIVGTHNGTILNADRLFDQFNLPRQAETDSEVIFRLADKSIGENGRINLRLLAARLALCTGTIASVMVSKLEPERVIMLRGSNPLEFAYSTKHQVLLYASKMRYIREVVGTDRDWERKAIPDRSLVAIGTRTLKIAKVVPVNWPQDDWRGSDWKKGLWRYMGV